MHSCARGELRCGNWRKSTGTVGRCKRRLEDASGGACNGKPVALQVTATQRATGTSQTAEYVVTYSVRR